MKGKFLCLLAGVIACLSFQSVSYAQTRFTASLNAAQEVPAPMLPMDARPTGTAVMTLRGNATDGFELKYDVTVTGLSGPIRAGHFHNGPVGMAGGVVRGITFNGNNASGVWKTSDAQSLTPALVQALFDGEIYLNVHTAMNPAGEIRGQVWPTLTFVAHLDTAQEVPAPMVMGDPAGTAYLTLRGLSDGRVGLSFDLTVDGLSGSIGAAHFHNGPPGMAGPVVRSIASDFGGTNTASGTWNSGVQTQPLTPALLKELIRGNIYLNVHTAMNPAGEIRGQVVLE